VLCDTQRKDAKDRKSREGLSNRSIGCPVLSKQFDEQLPPRRKALNRSWAQARAATPLTGRQFANPSGPCYKRFDFAKHGKTGF
jgi:hypothetical protein